MNKDRNMKKDSVYIEEINRKQEEINKLRIDNTQILMDYLKADREARYYYLIISHLREYIDYLLDNPTYKGYGQTLEEIKTFLKGV